MNKQKINVWVILKDGLILFSVSTVLVLIANYGFGLLKGKGVKDDPLVTAIHQDKIDELKEELENKENAMDIRDGHQRTALMLASYVNFSMPKKLEELDGKRAPMVALLLENGSPVDAVDEHGWTALMWASWSGMAKVVDELLKADASLVVSGKQGFTALSLAAMRGEDRVVKILLEKGADCTVKNKEGKTALDLAKANAAHYHSSSDSDQEKKARYEKTIDLLEGKSLMSE